jgi:hypothetical protein
MVMGKSFMNNRNNSDPLPSWNEGVAKSSVLGFVDLVTTENSPGFVKESDRIAGFDNDGKPVSIHQYIGKKPVAAFGNADSDLHMLRYTSSGSVQKLAVNIHHTDPDREFVYDRGSQFGKLEKGLEESEANGWLVVDMKKDWNTIYPRSLFLHV